MPIYEYQCSSCGHELEAMQKMSEAPLVDCPECHQPALRKLVSAAGFQLKGGGWYVTDFRDKGKKKETRTETGGESGGEAKSDAIAEGKTESKTEAKAETKTESKTDKPKSGSGGTEAA